MKVLELYAFCGANDAKNARIHFRDFFKSDKKRMDSASIIVIDTYRIHLCPKRDSKLLL